MNLREELVVQLDGHPHSLLWSGPALDPHQLEVSPTFCTTLSWRPGGGPRRVCQSPFPSARRDTEALPEQLWEVLTSDLCVSPPGPCLFKS